MSDVFLSYKREDKAKAEMIARGIEAHGFSVFYDIEIDVGDSWPQRIQDEVLAAKCVAVLWSTKSVDPMLGRWVQREARAGEARTVLAPALIETVATPLEFSDVQAADLRNWMGDPGDPEWRKFIARIGECVQQQPKPRAAKPWRRPAVVWGGAAVLAASLAGAAFVYRDAWLPGGPAAVEPLKTEATATVKKIPSPEAIDILAREWNDYFVARNCDLMKSWSQDYATQFPDWDLVAVASQQTTRLCPAAASAPVAQDPGVADGKATPPAPPLTAPSTPLAGDLLAQLRTQQPAPLTPAQVGAAATRLGATPAAIDALIAVQSGGAGGFGPDGRPAINFEAHVFSRLTGRRFDNRPSGVSTRQFVRGAYGKSQASRWALLEEAYGLDPTAALSATSWGRFRLSGMNYRACGFPTLEAFVRAMAQSEEAQLRALESFLINQRLVEPLRRNDWDAFARGFFGSTYLSGALRRAVETPTRTTDSAK